MRSHTTQFCLSARRVTPAGALAADNLYMHHHLSTLICLCLFVFVAATTLTCPTRRRCPPPPAVRGAAHSMHGGTGQGAAVAGHPVLLTPISAPSPSICCIVLWWRCLCCGVCVSHCIPVSPTTHSFLIVWRHHCRPARHKLRRGGVESGPAAQDAIMDGPSCHH